MTRIYNFSAGPAMLPEPVLLAAQQELLDWRGSGMSVMEISHRSDAFMELAAESTQDLRDLLKIPRNYHVLFLPGGARTQFAMIPLNLLGAASKASYVVNGTWGNLASLEAQLYADIDVISPAASEGYTRIVHPKDWQLAADTAYVHYVDNETVHGLELPEIPNIAQPLVADMSSNLLSRPFDVAKLGMCYACAQKNLGPAGVTIVIIRDDLVQRKVLSATPSMLRYQNHVDAGSMYNTPPTYPWYLCGLVFKWLQQQGGVEAVALINQRKADKLYAYLDGSEFYYSAVVSEYRSRMNVVFRLPSKDLDDQFVRESERHGMSGLRGHRSVGGIRASIYNAMPEAGVDHLLAFMADFERRYG